MVEDHLINDSYDFRSEICKKATWNQEVGVELLYEGKLVIFALCCTTDMEQSLRRFGVSSR